MNEVMSKIADDVLDEIIDKNVKQIIIEHREPRTIEQELALESLKKINNPFVMISAEYIMKDLGMCRNRAYALFREPDFPSVKIGKKYKVMFLNYVIWKIKTKGCDI